MIFGRGIIRKGCKSVKIHHGQSVIPTVIAVMPLEANIPLMIIGFPKNRCDVFKVIIQEQAIKNLKFGWIV
jgi:hypothetical protein